MYNPMTGDLIMQYLPWILAAVVALAALIGLFIWGRKSKKKDDDATPTPPFTPTDQGDSNIPHV